MKLWKDESHAIVHTVWDPPHEKYTKPGLREPHFNDDSRKRFKERDLRAWPGDLIGKWLVPIWLISS